MTFTRHAILHDVPGGTGIRHHHAHQTVDELHVTGEAVQQSNRRSI